MAEVKLEQQETSTGWEPHIKEEPESPHIKEEPEEFPFHINTVKTEEDQDKASVLHQRPTEETRETIEETKEETREETDDDSSSKTEDSSDTDHSEDYSQEQAPKNKRSYAMIPPGSCVTDHRPFTCSECGKRFRDRSLLQRHVSFVHSREKPHKCSVCGKGFTRKSHLSDHQRLVHHICPVCSESFTERKSLNEHLKGHVEDGTLDSSSVLVREPFSCSECGKNFRYNSNLQRHVSSAHRGEKPHKCSVCEKRFSKKDSLTIHMRFHTGEKPFVCSVCEKGFVNNAALSRHQSRVHHICPVCSERFTEKKSLNEHLKGHVEEGTLSPSAYWFRETIKPFSCSECGQSFREITKLQKHMSSVHRGEKPHTCSVCEKGFTKKFNLNIHMRIHTREKLFICKVCDTSFSLKSNLDKHMTTRHQGRTHHICPVCFESFTERKSLREHLKGHVGEGTLSPSAYWFRESVKPFSCSDCGQSFRNKSHLQIHVLSAHSVKKPYKCSVCEKRFTERGNLTIHMRTHTGEKPFICSVCGKGFTRKSHLSQHQSLVHHICPVCSERFTERKNLSEHLKGHVEEGALMPTSYLFRETIKPFSCSECEKSFRNVTKLERHVSSVHRGEKPHKCSVCEKDFLRKSNLDKHMRTQHQSRTHHICPVCFKSFTERKSLKEHLQGHVEEGTLSPSFVLVGKTVKPLSCSKCGKNFKYNSDLQTHLSSVQTGEKPQKCSVCERGSS